MLKVIFLGTGPPQLSHDRHGISTLIKAGPHWLLFDTGRSTLQRMFECGVPIRDITNVFYTHLHSDHICGFGDFWITGWFVENRTSPLSVWGPRGTEAFIEGMKLAHRFDLSIRPQYEGSGVAGLDIHVSEFEEGVVFDNDGVTVTSFFVDHGPVVKPAFGFRIAYQGRSVVLSGDTTYCESLVENAKGADLLINEMAGASAGTLLESAHLRKIVASHTSPEQLAALCTGALPRLTLLNHLSLWNIGPEDVLSRIRDAGYHGNVAISEDRMEVLVGEQIKVVPPVVARGSV